MRKLSFIILLNLYGCYLEGPPSTNLTFRRGSGLEAPSKNSESNPKKDDPVTQDTTTGSKTVLPYIKNADVLKTIQLDADKLNPTDGPKTRYFTLQTVSNAGKDSVVLDQQRAAFKKTINSLSTKAALVKPAAVDKDRLIYRLNLDDINMSPAEFDEIIADFYPFAGSQVDIGTADSITAERADRDLKDLLGTDIYIIRMDWFNATATLPVIYAKFMRFPNNLSDFEEQVLGSKVSVNSLTNADPDVIRNLDKSLITKVGNDNRVDRRIANILQNDVVRTGFDNSNVSFSNRIIERHAIAEGSYYITYDFFNLKAGDVITDANGKKRNANQNDLDRHNINKSPLGPVGTNAGAIEFTHDGGEVIYSLPNGMLGYYLINAQGTLLDKGPLNVVRQTSGPAEFSNAITNGLSCMSCHNSGLLKQSDTILTGLNVNRTDLDANDLARINRIYDAKTFNNIIDKENDRYAAAMKTLGIDMAKPDPIDQAFRFYNRALTKKDVLAELDVSEQEFAQILADPEFSGTFNPLTSERGAINRGVFQAIYATVAESFKQGFETEKPKDADFVVTVDCMAVDLVQMDNCVINPLKLNLAADLGQ